MEDYVYILDYVTTGIPTRDQPPISYGIGETEFTLLGLIPKYNANINNQKTLH